MKLSSHVAWALVSPYFVGDDLNRLIRREIKSRLGILVFVSWPRLDHDLGPMEVL